MAFTACNLWSVKSGMVSASKLAVACVGLEAPGMIVLTAEKPKIQRKATGARFSYEGNTVLSSSTAANPVS